MDIIINPERGGNDVGKTQNNLKEKDLLLELGNKIYNNLLNKNVDVKTLRTTDTEINVDTRIKNLLNLTNNKNNTILLSLSVGDEDLIEIIYPLSKTDKIPSNLASKLNNYKETKYFQLRNPSNPKQDYYYLTRNTLGYETILLKLPNDLNYIKNNLDAIANDITSILLSYSSNTNTYKVKSGDTLYSIAKKFNVTVNELKEINNLKNNNLSINQVLVIPNVKKEEVNEVKQNEYIVKSGDTLYGLAKKYNTTVDNLKEINNLKSNTLSIGQKLIISNKSYTIQKGDTLYSIAKKYNTTVDELKNLNNLKNNNLSINQILVIPN